MSIFIPASATPVEMRRETLSDSNSGVGISILWSNGTRFLIDSDVLRKHCPCATCSQETSTSKTPPPSPQKGRERLTVISESAGQAFDLQQILPVGKYAINIRWGDGHNSGIFPFETLRELCNTQGKLLETQALG